MSRAAKPWDLQSDDEKRATTAAAKRRGVRACSHPAWPAIVREARAHGWPAAFEADLYVHDVRALTGIPHDRPFVWALGYCGTHIIWRDETAGRSTYAESYVRAVGESRPRMWRWDGVELRAVSHEGAHAFLARDDRHDDRAAE